MEVARQSLYAESSCWQSYPQWTMQDSMAKNEIVIGPTKLVLKGIIVFLIDIFMRKSNQIYRGGFSISFSIIIAIKLRKVYGKNENHVLKTFQNTLHSPLKLVHKYHIYPTRPKKMSMIDRS